MQDEAYGFSASTGDHIFTKSLFSDSNLLSFEYTEDFQQLKRVTNKKQSVLEVDSQMDGDHLKLNGRELATLRSDEQGLLGSVFMLDHSSVFKMSYDMETLILQQIHQDGKFVTDFHFDAFGNYAYNVGPTGIVRNAR